MLIIITCGICLRGGCIYNLDSLMGVIPIVCLLMLNSRLPPPPFGGKVWLFNVVSVGQKLGD
jgi:hypothetical protein